MSVKVKICGIRNLVAAQSAIKNKADYLGFNFVKSSPRYIGPQKAEEIVTAIHGQVHTVGVFQNAPLNLVNNIAKKLNLNLIQLHGHETPTYINRITVPVIKTITTAEDPKKYRNV